MDWEEVDKEDTHYLSQAEEYLNSFNTDRAKEHFLGDYKDVYEKGKSYLPYLGTSGNVAHTILSGIEAAGEAYLRYQDWQSMPSAESAVQYMELALD